MSGKSWIVGAAAALPMAFIGGTIGIAMLATAPGANAACQDHYDSGSSAAGGGQPGVDVDVEGVPGGSVSGYSGEQLVNAAYVMKAAADLGLSVRDQTIGVMTAMGESSLRVLDYGDTAGPDSRGLFQQRDNGAWGTYEDRMDPYRSSLSFFRVLQTIQERDTLAPTIAAHRVQRNADPFHYERYWDPAVAVVGALAGVPIDVLPGTGGTICTNTAAGVPGVVNPQGWANPANGSLTSPYGMRVHPITGVLKMHTGQDIGAACYAPIWAANQGMVTFSGPSSGYGYRIDVDHGGGVTTRYAHMYADGLLVEVGDRVTGGQHIARVGNTGNSTGCHLHFEVLVNGEFVDPKAYLQQVGITLGT